MALDNNTEQKTKQLEVLLGQRSTDPHRHICTPERNYSHLGVVLKPANSIHCFRVLLVYTFRDERKLTTNF